MVQRLFAGLLCFSLVTAAAMGVMAQEGEDEKAKTEGGEAANVETGDPKELAKEAYTEGSKLFADEKYIEAVAAFRKAMDLAPSWKIYYNIGHSEAAAKHYGLAIEAFQMYLTEAGDAIPNDREEEVIEQIKELKNKVGAVKVTAPDGALVFIDDMERGTAPMAGTMKVSAGKNHTVVVKLGEEVLLEQQVRIWADEEMALVATKAEVPPVAPVVTKVEEEPVEEPVEEPNEEPVVEEPEEEPTPTKVEEEVEPVAQVSERKHPLRITGGIVLSVGLAGLAAGGATGTVALVKSKGLDCPGDVCRSQEDKDDLELSRSMATATNILLPVGGGLLVTGIVLLVVGRRLERKKGSSVMNMNVQPVISSEFGGLVIGGRFSL